MLRGGRYFFRGGYTGPYFVGAECEVPIRGIYAVYEPHVGLLALLDLAAVYAGLAVLEGWPLWCSEGESGSNIDPQPPTPCATTGYLRTS